MAGSKYFLKNLLFVFLYFCCGEHVFFRTRGRRPIIKKYAYYGKFAKQYKGRRGIAYLIALTCMLVPINSYAKDLFVSSQNEIFDNPFISIGVDQKSNTLTGYFSVLLTAPEKTDACKFAFTGTINNGRPVSLSIQDAVSFEADQPALVEHTRAQFSVGDGVAHIFLPKSTLPGDCDWILDAVGKPSVSHEKDGFSINLKLGRKEDWSAVNVIKSQKAFFYASPENSSRNKTFLVAGDRIYIYDEKPDWYYVKFEKRNKETRGWIKKTDTLLDVP